MEAFPQRQTLKRCIRFIVWCQNSENLADDMPDEKDLPYLEMLYRFVFGKNPITT